MKRPVVNIFVAMLMVLLTGMAVQAIDAPHNYSCDTCHTVHRDLGTQGTNNVCLVCHKPGSGYGLAAIKSFTLGDLANPFGSYTGVEPVGATHSAHNWASSDNNPQAASQPPTSLKMNSPSSITKVVACNRCHAIHARSADPNRSRPFLRMLNDNDEMCLDCHRSRNNRDHMTGSHPINFTYTSATSKVKQKPSEYNNSIVNANPGNPTSALKLVNGKVLCTTCHGVHYADSNSGTFDNHSSSVLGNLSTSSGQLLRTNMRGATATSTNICTNCHKGKLSHNGKSQNIQCADCHAGHVDYDALAVTAQEKMPNVYLVRRYMNVSTSFGAVRNKRVFYQYTGSQTNFRDASGTGVCQACHAIPAPGGIYPPEHSSTDSNVCKNCHTHAGGTSGSFSGDCSSCHGYPPPVAASGYTSVDETTSPHTSHAGGTEYDFSCTQCHKGNSHNSGTFQDVFIDTTGILASATATYNTGVRTCGTVYCHSNGTGGYKGGQNPISWEPNKKGTIIGQPGECNTCHDDIPVTNRHTKHIVKGYGCVNCHAATVSDSTTLLASAKAANGTHVNNAKDILFSSYNGVTLSGSDCANIYCHSNGKASYSSPVWTDAASGACGTCHATTPLIGGATLIGTNAHFTHLSSVYGPKLTQSSVSSCQNCHDYNSVQPDVLHVNGALNVGGGVSQCTTCHPSALPVWTDSTRLDCTTCHAATPSTISGISAPYKADYVTTGHGQYSGSNQCTSCHNDTSAHISGVSGDNKRLLSALGSGSTNLECTYCHNDPTKVTNVARQDMSPHVLDRNPTPTTGLCNACHDPHGTTNLSMIKLTINGRSINFDNKSTGFISKTDVNGFYDGLCQVCHTQTTAFRNTTTSAVPGPSSHYDDRNCWQCHDHKGNYAFEPVGGGCNGCHGYPPVESMVGLGTQNNYSTARFQDYSGGGGVHNVAGHIPASATADQAWGNCTVCHSTGSSQHAQGGINPFKPSFVNVVVDTKYRFNPGLPITYNGNQVDPPATNATGNCSNVSCHFQPTPNWSTER